MFRYTTRTAEIPEIKSLAGRHQRLRGERSKFSVRNARGLEFLRDV